MDTESLRAFVAIIESGSFTAAANQLHLTQPAISKRIRVLEQRLKVKLFDRIGKFSSLTAEGTELLPRAREILLSIDDAYIAINNMTGDVSGRLVVATNHHIGLWRIPEALKQFTSLHPEVILDLRFMDSIVAAQAIQRGQMEIGVITLPPKDIPKDINEGLVCKPLWEDQLEIVVARDHPLALSARVSLEELSEFPAILPDLTTFTGRIIHQLFERNNLQLRVAMSTNYLETIKMLITIGLGWSVLPTVMLDHSVQVLPLAKEHISRSLGYVYHQSRSLSNASRAFIRLLEATRSNS